MENLLTKLASQSDVKSVTGLADSIHVAKEAVKIPAVPVHERRVKCFAVFHQVLTANKPKLSLLALEGLSLMLRDATLLNDSTTKKPEDTLSVQMLKSLEELPTLDKQIQCQIITVIVQLISSNEVNVSLNDVYEALQICTKTFATTEDVSVKLAVRAAITQMLNSFCSNRHAKVFQHATPSQEEIAVLMDMTALLTEVYRRLSTAETIDDLQLGLDSVYSVLSAQPESFHKHAPLLNVFSTELVPCLLCLLHATDDKPPPTKSLLSISPSMPLKFNIFSVPESARSFYQVVEQVLRLLSHVPDAEPLALELFRNSLLSPHVSRRSEALRLLKRLFSTQSRFIEYLDLCAREPQFWPVVLSCLEDCSKIQGSEGVIDSIRVMNALFNGLFEQLQPAAIDKYTPVVHEILENASKARQSGQKSSQRLKVTKRKNSDTEAERLAKEFVDRLGTELLEWLKLDDMNKVDEKIQEFAAKIAHEFTDLETDHNQTQSLLNTDAVYLTIFAALSFCLRLRENEEPDRLKFFGQVTGSGCIVYANENWLNAIYDLLSQRDNLFNNTTDLEKSILIKIIEDYDGHNRKYLSTFIDEEEEDGNVGVVKKQLDSKYTNFENWIRDQLQSSWSTVLSILSKYSLKLDKKESTNKMQTDGVEATLESTTSLLRLLMTLRLPSEITWVFERIGEEVCLLEDLRQFIIKSTGSDSKKPWRINRIDALCIGLLLDNCIECGTMAPTSWKHTVRSIEYVTELEKYLFRLTKTANIQYDASEVSLADLLGKIVPNELSLATVGRVLDELMLKIDGFFEDAPKILNLPSLCALLSVMCTADEDNLRNIEGVPVKVVAEVYVPACSLPRISRLVSGSVQRRLLVHRLRIWGTVKDHFVETMSSKFPFDIAKLSINSVHECMRSLLGVEPDGSCFHQSLFTAYQNVLCCEVCSAETQEQIVASLATFIEDSPQRIGSGWKPLFGALKAIRISPAKQKTEDAEDSVAQKSALTPANHAVIGVFKRYIEIGDPQILIPTALEFIHCIVHYLQSTEGFEQAFPNQDVQPSSEHERDTQFGQTAFSFVPELKRQLLLCFEKAANGDLSQVPAPPSLLNRLRHREQSMEMVDEGLVDEKLEDVSDLSTCLFEDTTFEVQPSRLNEKVTITQKQFPWTDWTDGQKCVVELLLSFIDELAGLTLTCSRQILSQLLTGLATFVGSLRDSQLGLPFGIHSLCSNILPLIQKWSRREHRGFVSSAQIPQSLRNLKQTTTVFAELAVDYVRSDPQNEWNEHLVAQILVLFNDLISHQSPFIAGTGSACLRHFISSLADELSIQSLSSVTSSLWKATCLTMAPIRKLIAKFVVNSVDLNGDIGEVHVIVKEDAQTVDYSELRAMAFQIFQIEQQTHRFRQTSVDEDGDEKKRPQFAYVFVFRPKTTNSSSTQPPERAVTMDEIVAGLMSAQSLLQLFSFILLGTLHSATFCGDSTDPQQLNRSTSVSTTQEMETSIGRRLSRLQMGKVFACLDAVNFVANEFDQRPSLKYLLQKLINGDQVSNLYKLEVASQAIKLQTVYELAKQLSPTKDDVIKVTKSQGAANSNLVFLRLIDTLVDQSFSSLEDLEGQAIKSPSAAGNLRDRMDLECGQLRLSEDFETTQGVQPATPKTPTARTNPFLNRIQSLRSSSGARASTDSSDGLQVAQLSDLDLRLIAQSEIVAILIERVVREERSVFRVFLPLFLPKIRKLMRICPAKRARFACSEFLNRLDHELEISA